MGRTARRVHVLGFVSLLLIAGGRQDFAAATEASGSLLIESEPAGASVFVDGRFAGRTPLTMPGVAPGVHRVNLVQDGFLDNSRLVTVKSGARARLRTQLTAAAPPLKIVVVEGEGAVNIIQQKTAVAPVIEVRDRNDQPVSGAVVRFAISKGRATFNGARTLTATTDALGRATAAGLTPSGTGSLSIATSATFQGQTAAITIAQTNVLTAAQAAAAASAGSSGASAGGSAAAGGGGGGLSNTAIVGIVGGAGAGIGAAVLAANASSGSESPSDGNVNSNTGWSVLFTPGLNVSACSPEAPGGMSSQNLNVNASGAFRDTWGSSLGSAGEVRILEASGTLTATGISGTLRCFASAATGTISATPSGGDYLGTVTLGAATVSIRVIRRQGP